MQLEVDGPAIAAEGDELEFGDSIRAGDVVWFDRVAPNKVVMRVVVGAVIGQQYRVERGGNSDVIRLVATGWQSSGNKNARLAAAGRGQMSDTVTFEQFCETWLSDVREGDPSTTELGHRFAHKLVTQWLDIGEDADDSIVYCDGAGDGGIDLAFLDRKEVPNQTPSSPRVTSGTSCRANTGARSRAPKRCWTKVRKSSTRSMGSELICRH